MTGVMFTDGHAGHRYWVPCESPAVGLSFLAGTSFVYGKGWGHPDSKAEFGTSDGVAFTPQQDVALPWKGA